MSQVIDVAEKEIQEPVADQVITLEQELCLCLFVECSLLANIQYFCLLGQSVLMNQLDCGEWILGSPYGEVSSSLYLMSHCLCSTAVTLW